MQDKRQECEVVLEEKLDLLKIHIINQSELIHVLLQGGVDLEFLFTCRWKEPRQLEERERGQL